MFLNRVLIPLHKVKCLGLYHAQVRKQENIYGTLKRRLKVVVDSLLHTGTDDEILFSIHYMVACKSVLLCIRYINTKELLDVI